MQSDGNVVLRDSASTPLWRTGTGGGQFDPRDFIMQTDGNLVLYDTSGQARWESKTSGNPGAFLNVQDDGNLVVYRAGSATETANNSLWSSGTNVPPPLSLQAVVDSGAMLNVGDARLDFLSYYMLFGGDDPGGRLAPYTEQGFWSEVGPAGCGENPVTVNANIDGYWHSGPSWTSSQLQDALATALGAVMQAVGDKTAYQNYSYTEFPEGDVVVCLDAQPSTVGHYIPPKIQITAWHNGAPAGQVTMTYSTEDQSGETTCDILSALGSVLTIFPEAAPLAAIVGVATALHVC